MIDLRSDSVTKPTDEMRKAAANAETGHDGYGADPTIAKLEQTISERTGKDDAIFLTSGTLANLIAMVTHTEPGQEIILERSSHIYTMEVAGVSQVANLLPRPVDGGARGVIEPHQVKEEYSGGENIHLFDRTQTGLLALENTHNAKGGTAISPSTISNTVNTAKELGLKTHLDGARVFRAAAAHECEVNALTEQFDSVYVDFAKIGAPFGVALCGDKEFIERASRYRQVFGGHMKQGGIVAAPALVALNQTDRLNEDIDKAKKLSTELNGIPNLEYKEPETNILYVDVESTGLTAPELTTICKEEGILLEPFGEFVIRVVTHRDVSSEEILTAAKKIESIIKR